jgi:hypothetical protein
MGRQYRPKAFPVTMAEFIWVAHHSGHFCGMAQLLSGVNYNESSTVWAQDKWKGIMKLRWIMVKDIPNA